jgi:hypothetical protein
VGRTRQDASQDTMATREAERAIVTPNRTLVVMNQQRLIQQAMPMLGICNVHAAKKHRNQNAVDIVPCPQPM